MFMTIKDDDTYVDCSVPEKLEERVRQLDPSYAVIEAGHYEWEPLELKIVPVMSWFDGDPDEDELRSVVIKGEIVDIIDTHEQEYLREYHKALDEIYMELSQIEQVAFLYDIRDYIKEINEIDH